MSRRGFSVGCHNLHDDTGTPTFFADLLLFTEAIPSLIADKLPRHYRMSVCKQQRDLVVAYNKELFRFLSSEYIPIHDGVPEVTPHRGIYVAYLEHLPTGRLVAVVLEHRINAAFFPFIRGEARFRRANWRKHTSHALELIRDLKKLGVIVVAGGDVNTPRGRRGYRRVLREVGKHFDRLASNHKLRNVAVLSRMGSDHPRLYAELTLKD